MRRILTSGRTRIEIVSFESRLPGEPHRWFATEADALELLHRSGRDPATRGALRELVARVPGLVGPCDLADHDLLRVAAHMLWTRQLYVPGRPEPRTVVGPAVPQKVSRPEIPPEAERPPPPKVQVPIEDDLVREAAAQAETLRQAALVGAPLCEACSALGSGAPLVSSPPAPSPPAPSPVALPPEDFILDEPAQQAASLSSAARSGAPFCAACAAAAART